MTVCVYIYIYIYICMYEFICKITPFLNFLKSCFFHVCIPINLNHTEVGLF